MNERNLTLGQEGEALVLRLRSGSDDANGTRREARFAARVVATTRGKPRAKARATSARAPSVASPRPHADRRSR